MTGCTWRSAPGWWRSACCSGEGSRIGSTRAQKPETTKSLKRRSKGLMMGKGQGTPIEALSEDQVPELRNVPVYAGGEEIGHVGDIYYDEGTGHVACVGVK